MRLVPAGSHERRILPDGRLDGTRQHSEFTATRTDSERRVLMLLNAAVALFGPQASVKFLHACSEVPGTTPAVAAWIGGLLRPTGR